MAPPIKPSITNVYDASVVATAAPKQKSVPKGYPEISIGVYPVTSISRLLSGYLQFFRIDLEFLLKGEVIASHGDLPTISFRDHLDIFIGNWPIGNCSGTLGFAGDFRVKMVCFGESKHRTMPI